MKRKYYYFLPNIFTAVNMGCGFLSIIYSYQQKFINASLILILGALCDSVDGRIARLTQTQSEFGEQFDSLSDLISFGAAPAFLLYFYTLHNFGRLGIFIAFLYLLSGALRLARFNANLEKIDSEYFQGLPIPGAAIAMVGYLLLNNKFNIISSSNYFNIFYVLCYSLLMVSNIPFYSFKHSDFIDKYKNIILFIIFCLIGIGFVYYSIVPIIIMTLYVICALFYFVINRKKMKNYFNV